MRLSERSLRKARKPHDQAAQREHRSDRSKEEPRGQFPTLRQGHLVRKVNLPSLARLKLCLHTRRFHRRATLLLLWGTMRLQLLVPRALHLDLVQGPRRLILCINSMRRQFHMAILTLTSNSNIDMVLYRKSGRLHLHQEGPDLTRQTQVGNHVRALHRILYLIPSISVSIRRTCHLSYRWIRVMPCKDGATCLVRLMYIMLLLAVRVPEDLPARQQARLTMTRRRPGSRWKFETLPPATIARSFLRVAILAVEGDNGNLGGDGVLCLCI